MVLSVGVAVIGIAVAFLMIRDHGESLDEETELIAEGAATVA